MAEEGAENKEDKQENVKGSGTGESVNSADDSHDLERTGSEAEDVVPGADREEQIEKELEERIETAVEEALAEQRDTVLRAQAEVQNMRRRCEQDVEKAHKYALEKFSEALLPVMDNLERALDAVPDSADNNLKALTEGVELTLKEFRDVLTKFSIEQINPEGEPFDPQLHEAMTTVENPDVEPNTVIDVMQKGYTLHGRVIRPARVVVSKAG